MLNAELEAVRLMTDRLLEKVNDEHREEKKALINEHEVVRLQMKAEVDIANIQGELALQHWEFDLSDTQEELNVGMVASTTYKKNSTLCLI